MQETTLLIYSIFIVLVAWAGGLIPLFFRKQPGIIRFFISFGAGILLGASFLHMIPDAAESVGSQLGVPILLGFLTLYIFEKFIMTHPCHADECDYHTVGLSAFIGLSVHSLITGLALGAGVMVPRLGFIVFLAVILHKLPASLSLSSLLVKENYSLKSTLLITLIFSFMVPIGAFMTYFLSRQMSMRTIGFLIAFSAGTFLHVAADDLIPEVHHHLRFRKSRLAIFLIGIAVMWIVKMVE